MRTKVLEVIQLESWVSDGGYSLIQPEIAKRADSMIFLDTSLWQRLLNHAKRTVRSIGGHGELPFWSNMQFFIEMVHPDLRSTKKIEAFLKVFEGKTVILRSRKDVSEYLETLS